MAVLAAGAALLALSGVPTARASDLVIITGLEDFDLGHWDGERRLREERRHCIASTADDERFMIVITGTGPGGSFLMSNGAAFVPFSVEYRDQKGGYEPVLPGVPKLYQVGEKDPFDCDQDEQRMRITVRGSDLTAVPAGIYSATLTLTVTPM